MISKRKRNTILIYCMASVIMLCAFVSNVTMVTTELKTNTKRIVADNNYVETDEISYGLVAIEASSAIEENKDAQKVTETKEEEKKEEKKEESSKTSENKKTSSTSNKAKTAQSNKTTKSTSNKTTKSTSNNATKKATTKTTTNKTTSTKKATSTTSNTTSVSSDKKLGSQIASYAKQFVGNPYRSGGTSLTKGADCSGFVQSVFKHFGVKLPRTASSQATVGKKVSFNNLEPGDLVFYSNGGKKITHVAIYIGNGKIVHAQTPRLGIGITTYNIMTKVTARRVIN